MSIPESPPAFPVQDCAAWQYSGMALRDWFAGQAMKARLSHEAPCFDHGWEETAVWAYNMADAMLAEREEPHHAA